MHKPIVVYNPLAAAHSINLPVSGPAGMPLPDDGLPGDNEGYEGSEGNESLGSGDAELGDDYVFCSDDSNSEDQISGGNYPDHDPEADNPGSTGSSAPPYHDIDKVGPQPIIFDPTLNTKLSCAKSTSTGRGPMDKREISIFANAVANRGVGVRELRVQTEVRRYFFLRFENGTPYS